MEEAVPFEAISTWLPLPYRILLLFIIGIWLFAFNIHYFHAVRIDVSPFLRYTRSSSEPLLHRSIYQVALVLSSIFAANLLLFWSVTGGNPDLVREWEILPMFLFLLVLAIFFLPVGAFHKRGRWRFLRMFRRIITGGLDKDLRFADILLADALTSYAKVLGDAAMVACMFLSGYSSTHPSPDRASGGVFLAPCVIALPYLCRLRQCLIEYLRATAKGLPSQDCRTHLFNAAKYASAFPVIIIGALQRRYPNGEDTALWSREELTAAWYIAVVINSAYSFYWDVTKDWDLTLFTSRRQGEKEYPWGLRRNRHFVAAEFYYVAIALDLLLRCAWSVKLSPHLDFLNEMEGGIFILELLEVFRRWVWVFFRVEKEFVASKDGSGLGLVDVEEGMMLNEFRD